MDRYNGSEHLTREAYLIQGAHSNPHLTGTPLEEFGVMDNEMAPEFVVDQGPYYPSAANYDGYYCTGFESPGEWDDRHKFFGLDGLDLHYMGRNGTVTIQVADPFSLGRVPSLCNPLKVTLPANNSLADFGDKLRPRLQFGGVLNNGSGNPDVLGEQICGPRTNRVKSPLTSSISVKAYTTKAGSSNAQGNIVIHADQYNREDFPINYANAEFFVIKSYSEDDVHKSIKYNAWSSTPNGNKRLDSAYEDAQRISGVKPGNCPVFLFFSGSQPWSYTGDEENMQREDVKLAAGE